MNASLRHFTFRVWLTALAGSLPCLVLVPGWQHLFGLHWLILPAAVILGFVFWAGGWVMNYIGIFLIERQVREAAVWERSGMGREAEAALERAVALFDSLWLSPLARKQRAAWMTGRLARFYLSQARPSARASALIQAYLRLHPQDGAVAEGWLRWVLAGAADSPDNHELAVAIGEAQKENHTIQLLLMQYFLAGRRVDFASLQTYRAVWERMPEMPEDLLKPLAAILLDETLLNDWALKVYLRAYKTGAGGCLEGLAAALRWIRPHAENRQDLLEARNLLAAAGKTDIEELTRRFRPAPEPTRRRARPAIKIDTQGAARALRGAAATAASATLLTGAAMAGTAGRALRLCFGSPLVRRSAGVAILVLILAASAFHLWRSAEKRPAGPLPEAAATEDNKPPPAAVIDDPFTIQVAAYVKFEDAQRLVEKLNQMKLDAFSNKAASSQRTWYQVRVSHFPTKDQAQQFGEKLKAKGIIDDFYVANYIPPAR